VSSEPGAGQIFFFWSLAAIEFQHEKPERRRKIALSALLIDHANKSR
jgi:hypothetical protein